MDAWDPKVSPDGFKDFERQIVRSVEESKVGEERNRRLEEVVKHPFFRRAHPREEHFVPIYVAAGAGTEGGAKVVSDLHGGF